MQNYKKILLSKSSSLEIQKKMNSIISAGIYSVETVNGDFDPLSELEYLNKYISKEDEIIRGPKKSTCESHLYLIDDNPDPMKCFHKFHGKHFSLIGLDDKACFFFSQNEFRIKFKSHFCWRIVRFVLLARPPYSQENLKLLTSLEDYLQKEKEHPYEIPVDPNFDPSWEPSC